MCGVFGIYDPPGDHDRDVARLTYFGLYALQHRGQESAGIAVSDGSQVMAMKDMGLVNQVFDEPRLSGLSGHIAIGHARYSTTGSTMWQNAQPIVRHSSHGAIALGHNGNLTNTSSLRADLRERRVRLESTSDTEVIAALIAQHPSDDLADAVADTMSHVEGAFAAVVLSERALAGFRDPDGIRPLVVGRLDDAWVLASETCALDLIGARLERELRPGELVVIDEQGARFRQAVTRNGGALCIFEFIYFARPDSLMEGQALHDVRRRMGARLADEAPADADVVIGVPDSGTPAAVGYAERSGIPYGEGLVKNRYVGRTFIQPDQGLRERGVKLKFNTLRTALDGRRVVVVDDSIVRGSTTRKLVQLLFEAGAAEVHLRISSPPIVSPCFYGIDMADQGQLIAAGRTTEEVRERLGATSLAYLSLDGLTEATHQPAESFCRACLTGHYPTEIPADMRLLEAAVRGPARRDRMTDDPLTYEGSGVSLDAAEAVVDRIRAAVISTHGREVLGGHGGFAGLYTPSVGDPLLSAACDGAGTKVLLGHAAKRYSGLGIDTVAMSVNDVITSGGRPAFFLDHITCGRIDPGLVGELVEGVAEGCRLAGCVLLGGETAEHPGMMEPDEFDIAGFCVGVCERRELVSGARIKAGDTILGLPSSGPHSNGFSLVRKLLERAGAGLDDTPPELGGATVADALLEPTAIYARAIGELTRTVDVRGMAHITGGGIPGNLARQFPDGLGAEIDTGTWERQPVFGWLASLGVADDEMWRVFNMGLGFACVVVPESARWR